MERSRFALVGRQSLSLQNSQSRRLANSKTRTALTYVERWHCGKRWQIERRGGPSKDDTPTGAQPSLREIAAAQAKAEDERIRAHPMVKAALAAFPEAELIDPNDKVARATAAGGKWK